MPRCSSEADSAVGLGLIGIGDCCWSACLPCSSHCLPCPPWFLGFLMFLWLPTAPLRSHWMHHTQDLLMFWIMTWPSDMGLPCPQFHPGFSPSVVWCSPYCLLPWLLLSSSFSSSTLHTWQHTSVATCLPVFSCHHLLKAQWCTLRNSNATGRLAIVIQLWASRNNKKWLK